MQIENSESVPPGEGKKERNPYFSIGDLFFAVLACVAAVVIIDLGYNTWLDGRRTEAAKSTGEAIVAWMTAEATKSSATNEGLMIECHGEDKTWLNCLDKLVGPSGPFNGLSNQINQSNKLFSPACDRTHLDTLGSIIFEKGTPKPPDGASLAYAPLADNEPLGAPLSLRLSICGRGFSVIRIAEFTF